MVVASSSTEKASNAPENEMHPRELVAGSAGRDLDDGKDRTKSETEPRPGDGAVPIGLCQ
jgi:hypothetical protein